jgi:quercetin dioxygenase-like cupin family protein
MQTSIQQSIRKFVKSEHLKNVLAGDWVSLVNEWGETLPGIRGRAGAILQTEEGVEFGADLIEMQPGSAFALHTHPGNHILYIIKGSGMVHCDGVDYHVRKGDTIAIPAEYPHGVKTYTSAPGPLIFLAVGHPHKAIDSRDRMKLVEIEHGEDAL